MGLNMRNVVMFGVKLDYNCLPEDGYKRFEKFMVEFDKDKDKGVRILVDGMNGKYMIVGFPIVYSEDFQDGMMDMPLTEFRPDEVQIDEIFGFMKENFPEIKCGEARYIALSHYS